MDKIDQLRIYSILGLSLLARRKAVVETQTIEQFLVMKGICTIDEFREMRKKVEANSAEVIDLDKQIAEYAALCEALDHDINEFVEFSKVFSKALDGESLSENEHEFLEQALYGSSRESDPQDQ